MVQSKLRTGCERTGHKCMRSMERLSAYERSKGTASSDIMCRLMPCVGFGRTLPTWVIFDLVQRF